MQILKLTVSNKHSCKSQLECSTHQIFHLYTAVQLWLGSTTIPNNSVVLINDIGNARPDGDGGNALICSTTLTPCCAAQTNRYGEWYYPSGTPLRPGGTGDAIFRDRVDASLGIMGSVRLHRRNNALSPVGIYGCVIPDAYRVNQNLYVGIYTTSFNSE